VKSLLVTAMLGCATAFSAPKVGLVRSLEATLPRVASALEETSADDFPLSKWSDRPFALSHFMLRVRGKLGFEVPGFANLELQPELELVWERTTDSF
jgi:hypothetical protein